MSAITRNTAKKFLNSVREANTMIDLKQQRLDELKALADNIPAVDYAADKIQTSPDGDRLLNIIAKIVDLSEEINADIDRYVDLQARVMHVIDSVDGVDEQKFLYMRYFEGMKPKKIAAAIPCSERNVFKIQNRALEKVFIVIQRLGVI